MAGAPTQKMAGMTPSETYIAIPQRGKALASEARSLMSKAFTPSSALS